MYNDEEILEHLTEGEGRGFLGRSMYDAIIEKINKKEAMYDNLAVDYRLAQEEIERLNNIINELEKWLEERLEKLDIVGDDDIYMALEIALNKLQELKGSEMKNDKRSNN